MSKVVDFREMVMQSIRTSVTEVREVDWYDGVFDEKDIAQWIMKTPCAMVAVMTSTKADHHSTGELNVPLRCVVAIIDGDTSEPRNADESVWTIAEKVLTLANFNQFGHPDAGAATAMKLTRLVHPGLRQEGVAVAIVEWQTGLMIGRNRTREREFIYFNNAEVTQVPKTTVVGQMHVHDPAGRVSDETLDVTPETDG
jgi:hypothetical protein